MKLLFRAGSLTALLMLIIPSQSYAYSVLVIGDSISAAYGLAIEDGWVHLAEVELAEDMSEVEFINASISGDTTAGGLRRLPDALERFKPDLVVIELGGNDGLRGYPPKVMESNLESMASLANEAGAEVLLLGMMIPSNYGAAFTQKFSDAFKLAADASDSELVPFFLEPIANDRANFQRDGIHPTAAAQPALVKHVMPTLRRIIESADAL
jgi:acyl-CoA thioesterase-1